MRERFVSVSAESEDLSADLGVAMLEESEELFRELGERYRDSEARTLARRVARLSCDRGLELRIQRVLTPRGATVLANLSLGLLLLVFGLLFVESMFSLSDGARETCRCIDAWVCVFFIAEFLFKLVLAPARWSWFLRNVLTDLLPAIPGALWFVMPSSISEDTVLLRAVRFLRLPIFRLLLFMAKGTDALVQRFSTLLNRNLVFFDETVLPQAPTAAASSTDARSLAFRALRREQVLVEDLPAADARRVLLKRAERLEGRFEAIPSVASRFGRRHQAMAHRIGVQRDIPVEHAIENLYAIRSEDLSTMLPRDDVLAIDRVVRTLNAPMVRRLPILSWFRIKKKVTSPEERVVRFGRRIAARLERWRERALYIADLHGIVTGPQVLDRVASAMVKASFRPARNLVMFGSIFLILWLVVNTLAGQGSWLDRFMNTVILKFIGTPLLVLGSVCAIVLILGSWLKRIAGEASDQFRLTSEASLIGLLELTKRRSQDEDLEFLAGRVFRWDMDSWEAAAFMSQYVRAARTGIVTTPIKAPPGLADELYRVALLYLHFLDGALLNSNDVKTNDQLLGNLSLENIRGEYLKYDRKERRRLRKLWMQSGQLFGGPYLWFRWITESIALETA